MEITLPYGYNCQLKPKKLGNPYYEVCIYNVQLKVDIDRNCSILHVKGNQTCPLNSSVFTLEF